MKEADFNTEIVNSLTEIGAWAHKIPDAHGMAARFTPEKPCDIISIFKGEGFLIESKQMKKWEAFGRRHLRVSQLIALTDNWEKGNQGFVFLNVRIKSPYENRLILWSWEEFEKLGDESIKANELKELPYIKGYKERFDLTAFLSDVAARKYISHRGEKWKWRKNV